MHIKIVKIAVFLLRSKALNDIIKHVLSSERPAAQGGSGIFTFSRVLL